MPENRRQFISCHVGDSLFGIDVLVVREIARGVAVTHVDLAHASILGLMNLRGQIVTVVDLAACLGMQEAGGAEDADVVVLKTNRELTRFKGKGRELGSTADDMVGLRAGCVGDLIAVDNAELRPPPTNVGEVQGRCLEGVVKLDDALMAVVRIDELLRPLST